MCHNMIKILRIEKGFTQENLATKIHVVRQTISKWENGESEPSPSELEQIAKVLNVPVCIFYESSCIHEHKKAVKLSEYSLCKQTIR